MPLVSEPDADPGVPSSPWPATRRCALAAVLLIAAGSACAGDAAVEQRAAASSGSRSFALYALSRGQGVPEGARTALARAESALEDLQSGGADVTVTKERIGLEGETRLCASFADGSLAERTLERLRGLVAGVDLVNLAEEPCAPGARP